MNWFPAVCNFLQNLVIYKFCLNSHNIYKFC